MNNPVSKSWTEQDLRDATREYMIALEGKPLDLGSESRQRWHEKLGLLTHFVHCLWMDKFE